MMSLSSLESIPREILEQILDHLDQWTIPERSFRVQPNPQIFTIASTAIPSLKSLSLVSKACHHAIVPRLFKHVRIIHSISPRAAEIQTKPFSWVGVISDLASFLDRRGLGSCVQSLTLRVEGSYPAYYYERSPSVLEDQWVFHIEKQWQNLLRLISASLRRLTILASPYCLGMLLSIKLDSYIDEALHMPYHLLILEKSGLSSITQDGKAAKLGVPPSSSSILTDIKWTSMLLNEGSFLRYHADSVRNWQGELLSTRQINAEPCFPSSFCQSIRSIEYITAFPALEHMVLWMKVLKSMSNLEKVSFQTIPIQDLDPDPHQRGSAHFWILEHNRHVVYIDVFTTLVKNSANEQSSLDDTPFQHLRIIECTDMPERENFSTWRRAAREAEDYGWEWQQHEEDLEQGHGYSYRDRLIKKTSNTLKCP